MTGLMERPASTAGLAPAAAGSPTDATTVRVLLADGSPAVVVELGPADAADLLELHERLDERDRYLRFATLQPPDLPGYVARTLAPGSGAISLGARVRGRLAGAVQLLPLGGDVGEMSAVVDRAWRAHGMATVLLEALAARAVRAGVHRLLAEVLSENEPMQRVLRNLGLPLERSRDGGTLHIEVLLHADERYAAATEERYRHAAAASLRPLLTPASVAVVGAGRDEHSIGRAVLRSLRAARFTGTVVAINPHADEVEGVPCRSSLGAVPAPVDLAVLAVPAAAVEAVVTDCGEHGVRAVLILASGLAAVPGLPARLRTLADRYGLRIAGPNTGGIVGPGAGRRLDTTFVDQVPPAGDLGLVAQSGGVAVAAVSAWQRLGLGLSAMVAVGDALDVGARDALAWFDEDPGTALVALYAESEPDLRSLVRTAAHLARRVPVLALQAGSSAIGRRAAQSHTARAATQRVVREAAYASAGVQSVDSLGDLAAAVALLRGQPLPGPGGVAVLTNTGGAGVLAADALGAAGLPVEPLPDDVRARLRELLPPLATLGNPVDASATVGADAFAAALTCLMRSPAVGAVLAVTAPTAVSDPAAGVVAAAAAADGRVPVLTVRLTQATTVERVALPGAPDGRFLTAVADADTAARALAVAARRRDWLARAAGSPAVPAGVDVRAAREVLTAALSRAPEGGWLRPPELDRLLDAAGLAAVPTHWAPSVNAAVAAARRIGGPLVVKGVVTGVMHKGDAGLVRLPVAEPAEAGRVVAEWAGRYGERWHGAVVQPLVPLGDELLVGALRDPAAGPVVALGPGGRAADALGHRVHRLAPLTDTDVEEMLAGTGLFGTEHGRGLDRDGVADALRRVSWLVDALPEIAEVEVNPLVVTASAARVLDVRVRLLVRCRHADADDAADGVREGGERALLDLGGGVGGW